MPGAADHPYDRIIIGTGTTAAVYLSFFPPQEREKVGVIGAPEPWSARGQHRMGQTSNLLQLPLVEPVRPDGFEPHSRHTPQPSRDRPPQAPFLSSDVYARQLRLHQGLRGKGTFAGEGFGPTKFRDAKVSKVVWDGAKFKVSYQYGIANDRARKCHYAKCVIVATGPGPAQHTDTVYKANPAPVAGVYFRGDEYLDSNVGVRGKVVAVEGGSATAAWCAEKAVLGGAKQVIWFTRPDARAEPHLRYSLEKRFAAAFPAGDRNVWLKQEGKIARMVATLSAARWTNQTTLGDYRLRLTFAEGQEFFVDQYAAAVGATETAEFLGGLRDDDEMDPIVDTEGHLHPSRTAILGYRGKRAPFLIVGAGTFKVTKGREHQGVFERTKPQPERRRARRKASRRSSPRLLR
jgi:thioredoxin reductase